MERQSATVFKEAPPYYIKPSALYMRLSQWRVRHAPSLPITYLSTAITTAGYKTLEGVIPTIGNRTEVIAHNAQLASFFADILQQEQYINNQQELVILASDVGERPNWQEEDYMLFWFYTIAGIDPCQGCCIEPYLKSTFSHRSHDLTLDERHIYYNQFIQKFLTLLRETHARVTPIQRLIRLVDAENSLGCTIEKQLAETLGIPIETLIINNIQHTLFQQTAFDGKRYTEHIALLRRYGAAIPGVDPGIFAQAQRSVICARQQSIPLLSHVAPQQVFL